MESRTGKLGLRVFAAELQTSRHWRDNNSCKHRCCENSKGPHSSGSGCAISQLRLIALNNGLARSSNTRPINKEGGSTCRRGISPTKPLPRQRWRGFCCQKEWLRRSERCSIESVLTQMDPMPTVEKGLSSAALREILKTQATGSRAAALFTEQCKMLNRSRPKEGVITASTSSRAQAPVPWLE